jgi:hypothetical protein
MSTESPHTPSSVEGIKRLAQRIRRQRSVPHHTALNRAAEAAGFENFAHALHRLSAATRVAVASEPSPRVFITAYWQDLEAGGSGRETLTLLLRRPLDALIQRTHFRRNRHLLSFRRKAPDHIECRTVMADQRRARSGVCGVARVLLFVQATDLQPVSRQLVRPIEHWHSDPLRGMDHASTWRDTTTGTLIHVDEPYGLAVAARAAERHAWASRHGFELSPSTWPGMYAPHAGSVLHLLGREPAVVRRILASLAGMPAGPEAEAWGGESATYRPVFMSPREQAVDRNPRAPRDPRLARSTATTVPYALAISGHSRRPRGRMPLDAHDVVAAHLRFLIGAAERRAGVASRLERVRSELDDWVQVEYDSSELEPERFSAMYYGETGKPLRRQPIAAETNELVQRIEQVRELLTASYPDCRPLRAILKQLSLARGSAASWPTRDEAVATQPLH